jgi:hypothetical protein
MLSLGVLSLLLGAMVAIVGVRAIGGKAAPAAPAPFNYAAKFMCGEFDKLGDPSLPAAIEGPVKAGNYQTTINVHNPNSREVPLQKKAVLIFSGDQPIDRTVFEQPRQPGQLVRALLLPDFGLEIECQDIRKLLLSPGAPPAPTFIDGWVVVLSPLPLDIDAIYTGYGYNSDPTTGVFTRTGFAIHTERVLPTQGVQ